MRSTVWVGRVKSTVSPELLENAFARIGRIVKVETGFAGFAFVEYDREEDADKACDTMNKMHISGVGDIRVSLATNRGYEDACAKRDEYWKARGHTGDSRWCFVSKGGRRSCSMSRSGSLSGCSRSVSRKKSPQRWRSRSRHSHHSETRTPSPAGRKLAPAVRQSVPSVGHAKEASAHGYSAVPVKLDPAKNGDAKPARPLQLRKNVDQRVKYEPCRPPVERMPQPSHDAPITRGMAAVPAAASTTTNPPWHNNAIVPASSTHLSVVTEQFGPQGRAAAVKFFDGANARDMLLEGAVIVRMPDSLVPTFLNGFPYSFQNASQEGAMQLLEVLSAFIRGDGDAAAARPVGECTAEVRQTLIFGPRGKRELRKSLVVNGDMLSEEHQVL